MGSSLLEQLQKAGLVNEQRAKQVKQKKYKDKKQQKGKKGSIPEEMDLAKAYAQKAKVEKADRDRELNQKRKEEAERKAILAQVKQLVRENQVKETDGEVAYNFTAGKKVKRIYLSVPVHQQVVSGQLSVVNLNGRYVLVPAAVADKIKARDERAVVVDNRNAESDKSDENSEYADFDVPDDLMW